VTGTAPFEVALPPVSERISTLQQLVAAEAVVVPAELPGPQALADTAGLLVLVDRLQRVVLARLGDVDVRRLAGIDGAPTTSSWLRAQPVDTHALVASVATSRRLVQHPSLGEAVAEGRLSPRAAEQLGRTLAQLRPHLDRPESLIDGQDAQPVLAGVIADGIVDLLGEALGGPADGTPAAELLDEAAAELSEIAWQTQTSQLDRLERALVLMASLLPAAFLPSALTRITGALLPTRLEDAAERNMRDRRLSLTPLPDGGGLISGHLTGEA
jgi:hypothetical protein